jgi:hypothetical protein
MHGGKPQEPGNVHESTANTQNNKRREFGERMERKKVELNTNGYGPK